MNKQVKLFSICASIYIFLFLALNNFQYTSYPWVLFCIPPLVIWPVSLSISRHFAKIPFAWMLTVVVSAYYIILNVFLANGYPWSFFIIFALIWYPFSLQYAKRPYALSIFGFVWAVIFFSLLNAITTPYEIWAIYPIFGVLWWPLSMFFFHKKVS